MSQKLKIMSFRRCLEVKIEAKEEIHNLFKNIEIDLNDEPTKKRDLKELQKQAEESESKKDQNILKDFEEHNETISIIGT